MHSVFKLIDFLSPKITLYHKGELFHYSIVSGIISLITIILVIVSAFYFSQPIIWRKNPTTYIYESHANQQNIFSINSTFFLHLITMTSYNLSNLLEFDYNSFRVVGMQIRLNLYTEIYNKNLSLINHWLYGPCEKEYYNINEINNKISINNYYNEYFHNFVYIKKFYNHTEGKYYNINESNFQWPHTKYRQLNGEDEYYSIIVEKCEESTLNEILGKGNHCKSNLEINNIIESGKWIIFNYLDFYTNVKEYNHPNNSFFRSIENRLEKGIVSINRLNFNPMIIKTNKGYIFDNYDEKIFYEFDGNEILQEVNDKIYVNYNLLINNKMKYYERDYQKFQEYISEIGGFAQFISFFASVIIKILNEYIILKDTKSLISLFYNKEKKLMKNKKIELNDIIKANSIRERNESIVKFKEIDLDINKINLSESIKPEQGSNPEKIIKNEEDNKPQEDCKPEKNIKNVDNMNDNMKTFNTEQNVIINNKENDTDSIFNKKNKEFNFCSFLIYQLTFNKKYKKYTIYSNFRKKIISEEQLIKNHIIIYNLLSTTNINNQIYSLKEMINSD